MLLELPKDEVKQLDEAFEIRPAEKEAEHLLQYFAYLGYAQP